MVQFVINDTEEQQFWRIYEGIARQALLDIEAYYLNAYQSPELGRVLYDQQLLPIYKILERSLFIQAFAQIVEGQKNLGTVEGYLKILYSIFSRDAEITITSTPLHLQIDIVAPVQKRFLWTTKSGKHIITKSGKNIVFQQILAEVTDRELLSILKSTTNAGTFVEFTLNKEGII